MSTALYRRYRPGTLADLLGQDHVAVTLRNQLRTGQLTHAYLLAGMRGTGKTSTARILARAVNCLEPVDGEPCNRCAACVEILGGAAVDVLEIDAASNRGIDEMRELRDRVKYLPAALRRKVYIIDEAHMLTPEAWNAFLKTLEEPPAHVLFVLATTEPHKVPETVRSRVQRFDFRRAPRAVIEAHLEAVVRAEGGDAEARALQVIASAAQGSLRDALSLLGQALALGERPLTLDGTHRALGLADPAIVRRLLLALAAGDAAEALRAVATAFDAGAAARQLLGEVARLSRAAQMVIVGYPEGADVVEDELALCRDLAQVAPRGYWVAVLDELATTEITLRQPVDARLQVELAVLRLVTASTAATERDGLDAQVRALDARVAGLESGISPGAPPAGPGAGAAVGGRVAGQSPQEGTPGAPAGTAPAAAEGSLVGRTVPVSAPHVAPDPSPPASTPAATANGGLADLDAWESAWPALLDAVKRRDKMLAGILYDCRPLEGGLARLVIGSPHTFHLDRIRDPAKARILAEAAAELAGVPCAVETAFCGAAPDATPADGVDATQEALDAFPGSRIVSTRLRDEAAAEGGPRARA